MNKNIACCPDDQYTSCEIHAQEPSDNAAADTVYAATKKDWRWTDTKNRLNIDSGPSVSTSDTSQSGKDIADTR